MVSIFDRFIFSLIMFVFVTASDNTKREGLDRGAHSERGGLWFGPRLGKRSLQLAKDENSETFRKLLEAADELSYYYRQMPYDIDLGEPVAKAITKKIIFTPKLGRSLEQLRGMRSYDNSEFTPRLGRRKIPDNLLNAINEDSSEDVNVLTNKFSPRLGRNFKFSPRLGGEISDYNPYDQEVRVARSVNETN